MAFPTTGVIDDFNRANETPLSVAGAWATPVFISDGNFNLTGNQLVDPSAAWRSIYRDTPTYGPDSEVFITMPTLPTTAVELVARLQNPNTGSCLGYMMDVTPGGAWGVYKITSNIQNQIGVNATQAVANGGSVGMEVLGSNPTTINGYYRPPAGSWSLVITRSDSTSPHTAAGFIGLAANLGIAGGQSLDDFGGGTVVTSTPSSVIPVNRRRIAPLLSM